MAAERSAVFGMSTEMRALQRTEPSGEEHMVFHVEKL